MAGLFDDVLGSAPASQSGSGLFDDVLTKPPTDTQGDTSRGFTRAFAQVPELAYGTGALIGLTGEKLFGEGGISTATKDYFANKFVAKQAENQQYAPTVEFTDAWDNLQQGNLAPLADWLQDSAGYVVGQGIQTVATGGLGSIVGKTVLKSATETAMAGAVAKAADTMVRSAAEKGITLSVETATQAAAKNLASAIGAGVTLFAQNLGMEAGDIYGGLTEEAHKNNREITGDDLTRAWGAAGAAAGTEVLTDMLGLGALTGRIKIGGKGVQEMTGAGGRLARAGTAAAVGMPVEGAQEWVQTGLEQYGAGKPLDTPEAAKERINAAAVGALGGGLMGGGIGAIQGAPDTDAAIRAAQDVAFGQSTDTATAAIDAYTTGNMGPTGLLGAPSAGPTLIAGEAGVGTPEQQAAFAAQQDAERLAAMTAPADAAPTGLMGSIPIVGQPTITPDVSGGRTDTTGVRADDLLIPDTAQPATEPLVVPQTRVLSDIEAYQAAQQKQVRGELLSSYERTILDAGPMATPSKLVTEPARGMSAAEIVQRQGDRIPQQPMPVTQRQLAQEEQPGVAITVAGNANGVPVISTQSAEQTSVLTAALKAVGIKPHTINDGTVRVPKATPPEALQQVIDRVNIQFTPPRTPPTQGEQNGQGLQDTQTTPEAVAVAEVFGTGAQLRTASEVPQPGERVSTTMRAALTQIGRLTGTKVVFVSAEGADGATRSKDGNTVYINVRSSINPLQVLGHETTHVLKKKHREAWAAIRAAVSASVDDMALAEFGRDYWGIANPERAGSIPTGTGLTAWLDQRPDVVGVTSTEATLRDFLMDEMISDLGGGRFSDPEFWNNVFARIEQQHGREQAKTIIQRLVAAVKELIAKFMIIAKRDGFAEFKTEGMIAQRVTPEQLREIQKAIESAYAGFISAERTNEPAGYVRGAATPATGAAPGTQGTQGDDELAELEAAQQSTPRSEFGSYPKVQALGKPRSFLPGIVRRDADDKWSFVDKKTGDEYSYPTNAQAKTAMEQMARGVQESPRRADFTNQNLPARWPTAVGSTASVNDDLRSDLATLKLDQEQYEAAVNAVMAEVGMHSPDIANGTLDEKAEHIVKRMVDNLLWLFDKIPATERNRMKLWYDGARSIAEDWAHIYNISESQAAGILAVLSPQKDWYMNVTLAERILDILDKQMGHKFDQKMSAAAFAFMSSKAPVDGDKQQVAKNKQKTRNAYDAIQGKTLEQVMATGDQLQMGLWIRSFDEAYHDPRHAIITPEGGFGEVKGTKGGEDTVRAWGSFGSIGKAASIYANGTPANINEQLGGEHKVRNFYNNIFSPKDARFITIDTHAVAAALGRALSGNDDAVADNFGKTGGTNVTGMAGTYALYYEAYVRAAKARGVLPREMQSITWEAVRGLFRPEFKGKKENVLFIDNIWQRVDAGKLTARQARNRILTDTGIDKPTWWHDDEDYVDVLSPKSYEQSRPAFEGATVVFEVAPNPDNTEQKTRWDSLPKNTKDEISYSVAWRVLSRILASFNDANMKGELHAQNGGYGPDTNASLALWFNKRASGTKIGQMLQLAGYALDQKEMMRTAHKEFDTGRVTQPVKGTKKRAADPGGAKIKSTLMDAVVIALPKGLSQAQIHDIYVTIRSNVFDANGHTAGGHSTSDGSMIILNRQDDAEYGIDMTGAQLMNAIDLSLAGKYDVSHGKLHVDFASQGDNDYGIPRRSKSSRVSGKTLSGSSLRARADQFRSEAETLLETLIAAAEQRSGPDATSSRPAGESPASQSLPRYGRAADRHAVSVTGVHYSREQRDTLSSAYFGTGLKGQERLRVRAATDPRIKRRLYFYANTGRGITPEADVGSHAHTVGLDNVYDMDVDALRLYPPVGETYRSVDQRMNDFESAVLDAGYDGYMTREFGLGGAAVLLGDHSVPVQYEGAGARPDVAPTPAPQYSDLQKLRRQIAENRALPSGRLSGLEWKRVMQREMPEVDPRWLDNSEMYYKGDLLKGAEEAAQDPAVDVPDIPAQLSTSRNPINGRDMGLMYESGLSGRAPRNTREVYKLMSLPASRPGVVTPLFAKPPGSKTRAGFVFGKWYPALAQKVAIGNKDLAYRPGHHAVSLPIFDQGKGTVKGEQRVWVLAEMPAITTKTQRESDTSPALPNGMRSGVTSRVLGSNESYNFKTNPSASDEAGGWPISGSMRLVRVLSDAEVAEILSDAGMDHQIDNSRTGVDDERAATLNAQAQQVAGAEDVQRSEQRLAPNGKPSKLNEQQWAQVRTPEFKAWFGDWEKHARADNPVGSLWSDDSVSKIVDENGEPLVVYHGTQQGGFDIFRSEKGDKHRSPMLFATADAGTARSYSGRPAEIAVVSEDKVARWDELRTKQAYNQKLTIEEHKELIQLDGIFNVDGFSPEDTQRGIYHLFLNIRNPNESDFEGANWDGDATGLYEVIDENDEEYVYADDGRRLMDDFDSDDIIAYWKTKDPSRNLTKHPAFIGETTNSVGEDAKRMKMDGAIIRNVVDDGGKHGYGVDPSDVFVFFDSNQVKSATQNTGAFSRTDPSILRSTPRFYSQLARSVSDAPAKMDGQPASQWVAWINGNASKLGVKKEEIQWSGVLDWLGLRGKERTTRSDVGEYLEQGGVQVETVTLENQFDEDNPTLPDGMMVIDAKELDADEHTQAKRHKFAVVDEESGKPYGYGNTEQDAIDDAYGGYPEKFNTQGAVKFAQYVPPGSAGGYREVLLTLPSDNAYDKGELTAFQRKMIDKYDTLNWRDSNFVPSAIAMSRTICASADDPLRKP
jgi:hypothetical protein